MIEADVRLALAQGPGSVRAWLYAAALAHARRDPRGILQACARIAHIDPENNALPLLVQLAASE